MNAFLVIVACILYFLGAVALVASKSDIQIIIAVLCFGFGTIIYALQAILRELQPAAVAKASPIEDAREPIREHQQGRVDSLDVSADYFRKRREQRATAQ